MNTPSTLGKLMFTPNKDGVRKLTLSPFTKFVNTIFIPICVFVISLGSFSEAFILIDDLRTMLKSKFSNDYEYETLASVHVGNTSQYIENLLGAPAAAKQLESGVNVNYYISDKYLLTGYFEGDRIAAYTVVAIADGFSPDLAWYPDVSLGEQSLSEVNSEAQAFSFDNAKTNRFFIELSPNELSGFFQNSYFGVIQYGAGDVKQDALDAVYKAEVYGDEGDGVQQIKSFRKQSKPNLYGQGELDIDTIQQGLLSNGEFLNFFSD